MSYTKIMHEQHYISHTLRKMVLAPINTLKENKVKHMGHIQDKQTNFAPHMKIIILLFTLFISCQLIGKVNYSIHHLHIYFTDKYVNDIVALTLNDHKIFNKSICSGTEGKAKKITRITTKIMNIISVEVNSVKRIFEFDASKFKRNIYILVYYLPSDKTISFDISSDSPYFY